MGKGKELLMIKRRSLILEEMNALEKLSQVDPEYAHSRADKLLCSCLLLFGERELVDAFEKLKKHYA